MAQEKALDALAPFVALSKSANTHRYAVDLIVRAISHPDTYVFAELLYKTQIQALAKATPNYAAYFKLLKIYSYGTYDDYVRENVPPNALPSAAQLQQRQQQQEQQQEEDESPSSPSSPGTPPWPLPRLDEVQTIKLRQLSLLSLAKDRASLGYDHLKEKLHLRDKYSSPDDPVANAEADAALESLVMSAVYAGLLQATLDPARRVVRISSVAPVRDPAPGPEAIETLHSALQAWSARCEATLAGLDAQVAGIRQAAAERAAEARQRNARFDRAVETERLALRARSLN